MEAAKLGAIFGRILVAGALATAVFAMAAGSGILPGLSAHGPERRERGHRGLEGGEIRQVVELLRQEGFSDPTSLEREHGMIEAEATGPDGRRYEIHIDPEAKRILKREEED